METSIFPKYEYKGITHPQKTILVAVSKYAESFLRFAPRKIQNFPSHGVDHSVSIIRMINSFPEEWGIKLTRTERFILYAAAWLHDIGCVKDRTPHNKISVDILMNSESICDFFNSLDSDLLFILEYVIESHSSSYDIMTVPAGRGAVRVRLICAIFRLLDACEITNFKCPKSVYTEIKDDLKTPDGSVDTDAIEFWEGHMNIKDLGFFKPEIVVLVNHARKSKKITDRLVREIESVQDIFRENGMDVPVVTVKARTVGID
jgi:hypothetical protein